MYMCVYIYETPSVKIMNITTTLKHCLVHFDNLSRHSSGGSVGKESACNAGDVGDVGSVPESGRSPGGGDGNPLQYSFLEIPMNSGAWQSTVHRMRKSRTPLSG